MKSGFLSLMVKQLAVQRSKDFIKEGAYRYNFSRIKEAEDPTLTRPGSLRVRSTPGCARYPLDFCLYTDTVIPMWHAYFTAGTCNWSSDFIIQFLGAFFSGGLV